MDIGNVIVLSQKTQNNDSHFCTPLQNNGCGEQNIDLENQY